MPLRSKRSTAPPAETAPAPPPPTITVPPFQPRIGDTYEVKAASFFEVSGQKGEDVVNATTEFSTEGLVVARAVSEGRIIEASVIVTRSRLVVMANGEVESEVRSSQEEFIVDARNLDEPTVVTLFGWGADDTDTDDALSLMDVGTTDEWRREARSLRVGESVASQAHARFGTIAEITDMMKQLAPEEDFQVNQFEGTSTLHEPRGDCAIPFGLTLLGDFSIGAVKITLQGTGESCMDATTGLTLHQDDRAAIELLDNGEKGLRGSFRVLRTMTKR